MTGLARTLPRAAGRWAALAFAFALVAACGGGSSEIKQNADGGGTVSLGLPGGGSISQAPYWLAHGTGAFERQGITIEPQEFATGIESLAALSGGSVDMASIAGLDVIRSGIAGSDVVAIFVPFQSAAGAIIGAKKHEHTWGSSIAAYDGATWGYAKEGDPAMIFMRTIVEKEGRTWDDQPRAALGSQTAIYAAMEAGRIDIGTFDTSTAATAVSRGVGYVVINTSDPEATAKYWDRQFGSAFATTKRFIRDNPELVKRFVTAMVQGQLKVQEVLDDDKAVFDLMPKVAQDRFGEDFAQKWAIVAPSFAGVDGSLPESIVANTYKSAVEAKAINADTPLPPMSSMFDPTFVEQAYQTLGAERPGT